MIVVKSFDGTSLDDATYQAGLPGEGDAFGGNIAPIILDVVGGYQRYEGGDVQGKEFTLEVSVLDPTKANVQALSKLFRKGHDAELLIQWDGVEMVRDCAVISVHPMSGSVNVFVVVLFAADPRWRTPAVITPSQALTATGQTLTATNPGNAIEDRGIIRLTPTTNKAATAAQRFRRYVIAVNRAPRALLDWPIDITNYDSTGGPSGGLDHAALVTALKSQADAKDVRVLVDGREVPRFIGEHADTDANSARMAIWIAIPWSAMQEAHLRADISAVSPANGGEIEVEADEVRTWPKRGQFLTADGEVIGYTGWTRKNASGYSAFTGIRRAMWGTTAAISTAGEQLLRAEHKIEIIYGQTSNLTAPETRPDVKPMLDLASATISNKRHEWIAMFDDAYPNRPGQWARRFEPRDAQAGFMYLPNGSPASNVNWEYIYRTEPIDKQNYNVLRRAFPVGTDGTSGQLALTRTVDTTLVLKILGVLASGQELQLDILRGALASGAYSAAWASKAYELAFYAASQVLFSTPEIDDNTLLDDALATSVHSGNINNTNATGALLFQPMLNDSAEPIIVRQIMAIIWQPDANPGIITMSVYPDDGTGAALTSAFRLMFPTFAPAAPSPAWVTAVTATPFPVLPGGKIHLNPNNIADTTISQTKWQAAQLRYEGQYPWYTFRVIGDGPVHPEARAEGGSASGVAPDNVTIDGVSVEFDTAAIPSFAMMAESDCYELNGTLVNETTKQEIRFLIRVATNDEVEIDVGERTVRNLTTGEEGLLYGIFPSDDEAWISFVPGDNVLRLDETGLAGLTLEAEFYGRWE